MLLVSGVIFPISAFVSGRWNFTFAFQAFFIRALCSVLILSLKRESVRKTYRCNICVTLKNENENFTGVNQLLRCSTDIASTFTSDKAGFAFMSQHRVHSSLESY